MERPCSSYGCPSGHGRGLPWGSAVSRRRSHCCALFQGGQRKGNGFMMGIHQQQDGISHHRFASLVRFPNEIARPPYPQTTCIACIPGLLGHLLSGGVKPRDVEDAFATNGAALEEFAALKDRLGVLNLDHAADKIVKGLLFVGQLPSSAR